MKRVLNYLNTTMKHDLIYDGSKNVTIIRYFDSDYAGSLKCRKSTSRFIFLIAGGAVSCKSKKQSVLVTSSCEAEPVANAIAARQAIWLYRIMSDLSLQATFDQITIRVDKKGARDLAINPTINERSKHIDVKYH